MRFLQKKFRIIDNPFVLNAIYSRKKLKSPDIAVPLTKHYGQRAEDLIVKSILEAMCLQRGLSFSEVWYLEIGANHPIATSATFLLYEEGARGCLIEANPNLIDALFRHRPEDQVEYTAVKSKVDEQPSATLYLSKSDELSTLNPQILKHWPEHPVVETRVVPSTDIETILKKVWNDKPLKFLSIDIEGLDFSVLCEIDFEKYKFDIIQLEPSDYIAPGTSEAMEKFLLQYNYALLSKTEVNLIFVKIGGSAISIARKFGHSSFDVFDTLIARRFLTPRSVLEQFAKDFNIDLEKRIQADDGNRSLEEIYKVADLDPLLIPMEIEYELKNAIPIKSNIERVSSQDKFVSDMYLNSSQIKVLLAKFGLEKNSLHVSNSDKRVGVYWESLSEKPLFHIGDSHEGDVINARKNGVRAILTQVHKMSENEAELCKYNFHLAYLIRELRLTHFGITTDIATKIAVEKNLPFLFAACEILQRENRFLVFLGRDCQKMYDIYTSFYGQAMYLPFSRIASSDTRAAKKYLKRMAPPGSLLIDLVSTGATWARLDDEFDVRVVVHVDHWSYAPKQPQLERFRFMLKSSELSSFGRSIETINCADHGYLIECPENADGSLNLASPELTSSDIELLGQPVKTAIGLNTIYKNIAGQIKNPEKLLKSMLSQICEEEPQISQRFSYVDEKEKTYLDEVVKKFEIV
jgi:hypothetical protein